MERAGEATCGLALCFGEIEEVRLEPVSPDMRSRFGIDQLHVHPHLLAGPPNAPFQYVADAKLARDLPSIDGSALVGKGGSPGDHEAICNARQVGCQIIRDRVREVFLLRIG